MPQFKALSAIFYACFSRELYRDAYLRWQGLGFGYLLFFNALLITPVLVVLVLSFESRFLDDNNQLQPDIQAVVDEVISQIPPMHFEAGEMQTDAPQPYSIYVTSEAGEKQLFAQINLDGGLNELRASDAALLLTRAAVHAKVGEDKIETRFWKDMSDEPFDLNQDIARLALQQAIDWLQQNKSWMMLLFGVLLWAGTLLVMFIYRGFQALLLGGTMLILSRSMQLELRYADAVRLSCLAMTPPLLLDLVFGLLIRDQMSVFLFLAIAVGYQVFAIKSIKQVG